MSKKIMNYLPPFRPKLAEKRSEFIEIWHTQYFKCADSDLIVKKNYELFTTCQTQIGPKIKNVQNSLKFGRFVISNTLFSMSMVYFLLSLSMLKKKPFSASKCAKAMLAYRKRAPYCFMQQTTALHEHGSKCCSMEIFNEFTCQNI